MSNNPATAVRLAGIEQAMQDAEALLMRERYETKRTKREPYETFNRRRVAAMAKAAIEVDAVEREQT